MKQKTAIIETFEHLEDWLSSGKDVYQWIYLYKDIYIEKEKEQIMNAYAENIDSMYPPEIGDEMCEDYYNETYKQD